MGAQRKGGFACKTNLLLCRSNAKPVATMQLWREICLRWVSGLVFRPGFGPVSFADPPYAGRTFRYRAPSATLVRKLNVPPKLQPTSTFGASLVGKHCDDISERRGPAERHDRAGICRRECLGSGGRTGSGSASDIFQGDVITTDKGGEAQIKFLDNTRFVVGPGSKVTIDEFVFNPNGTAASIGLAAVKGTFRFIGGSSTSDTYKIRTPTATIGIRGTALDFAVNARGETTILWQEGSGQVCVIPVGLPGPLATECRDAVVGDMFAAPRGGGFGTVSPGAVDSLIYANTQAGLAPEFQLDVPPPPGRPPPSPAPRFSRQPGSYQ